MSDDVRSEFVSLVQSFGAYLEFHEVCGTVGFPKGEKPLRATVEESMHERERPHEGTLEAARQSPREAKVQEAPLPAFEPPPFEPSSFEAPKRAAKVESVPPPPKLSPEARRARLEVLQQEVASCTRCALAETRKNTVFARGNAEAPLYFVGEAPGADEDEQGLPFVGRAGQLLDKMIVAMGLNPETDAYVCNIIKCRPPGNRRPMPEESAQCMPYIDEQLALGTPRVIVALGNTAASGLLGGSMGITKIRGQWKLYKGKTLVMPTFHPSYLLRPGPDQAKAKKDAWSDLQMVMKELGLGKK